MRRMHRTCSIYQWELIFRLIRFPQTTENTFLCYVVSTSSHQTIAQHMHYVTLDFGGHSRNLWARITNCVFHQKSISDTKHLPSIHSSNIKSQLPDRKHLILTSRAPHQDCKCYYQWCQSKYHFLSNFHVHSISIALTVHENTLQGCRPLAVCYCPAYGRKVNHSLYFIVQYHRLSKNFRKMSHSLEWTTVYRTQTFSLLSTNETQSSSANLTRSDTVLEEPSSTLTLKTLIQHLLNQCIKLPRQTQHSLESGPLVSSWEHHIR